MSVYRRKYRVKGVERMSRYYTAEFTTPSGRLVRKSTYCTNKAKARAYEARLQLDEMSAHAGQIPKSEANRAITQHIAEFVAYLRDELKLSAKYAAVSSLRLTRMADETLWQRLGDITLRTFETWRKEARWHDRPLTGKTLNQFLAILSRFLIWAKKRGRIQFNPLTDAERVEARDNPDYRRDATADELARILAVLSGDELRFWGFVIYCPLRRRTLESLRWSDVHEADAQPWISVRGETIKGKKAIHLPLRRELADMLGRWRSEIDPKPTAILFAAVPDMRRWRRVLDKAGVEFDRGGIHRLDLHALRRTFANFMRIAGVRIEDTAAMLGHRDINTTRKYYSTRPDPMTVEAVGKMPKLTIDKEYLPRN